MKPVKNDLVFYVDSKPFPNFIKANQNKGVVFFSIIHAVEYKKQKKNDLFLCSEVTVRL